jgi:hypothetical protein
MSIQEMVKAHTETTIALEELKKKYSEESKNICVAVLSEVAEKTGTEFKSDCLSPRINTKNGVLRVGFAYDASREKGLYSILFYNRKKDGEESSRWTEQIHLGGGSKSEQFISWSNKTGSSDIDDVVQYIIDKYIKG